MKSEYIGKLGEIKSSSISGRITGHVVYLKSEQVLVCPYYDEKTNKQSGLVKDDPYSGSIWVDVDRVEILNGK